MAALRSFHSCRGRRHCRPERILHRLHALPGRSQPGQLAGLFRISNADLSANGHGCRQRQPLRRRQRRGGSRIHGHQPNRPNRQSARCPKRSSRISPDARHLSGQPGRARSRQALPTPEGYLNPDDLKKAVDDETVCVVVQHPNFFGCLEEVEALAKAAKEKGAVFIVSFDPISLGLLKKPGDYGADIAIARRPMSGKSVGLWRAVPGRARLPRAVSAQDARPAGRTDDGSQWQALLGADHANPRAAHSPGQSHQQHLHEPRALRLACRGLFGGIGTSRFTRNGRPLLAQSPLRGPAAIDAAGRASEISSGHSSRNSRSICLATSPHCSASCCQPATTRVCPWDNGIRIGRIA